MESKLAQEQVPLKKQTAEIHWTTRFTKFLMLLFVCFVLTFIFYYLLSYVFLAFSLVFPSIQYDLLLSWMFGCAFFFTIILPPFLLIMSIIALQIAKKPAWRSGKKEAEGNVFVAIALMLLWCFMVPIFLMAQSGVS